MTRPGEKPSEASRERRNAWLRLHTTNDRSPKNDPPKVGQVWAYCDRANARHFEIVGINEWLVRTKNLLTGRKNFIGLANLARRHRYVLDSESVGEWSRLTGIPAYAEQAKKYGGRE